MKKKDPLLSCPTSIEPSGFGERYSVDRDIPKAWHSDFLPNAFPCTVITSRESSRRSRSDRVPGSTKVFWGVLRRILRRRLILSSGASFLFAPIDGATGVFLPARLPAFLSCLHSSTDRKFFMNKIPHKSTCLFPRSQICKLKQSTFSSDASLPASHNV